MNVDININDISNDDLILLYNKVEDFIKFLDGEITSREVEKTTKKWYLDWENFYGWWSRKCKGKNK